MSNITIPRILNFSARAKIRKALQQKDDALLLALNVIEGYSLSNVRIAANGPTIGDVIHKAMTPIILGETEEE